MKFNRILAAILAVTVVGANMPAVSVNFPKISMTANAEGTESPLKYKTLEDGTIEITGCDKSVTTVEIPAEIDGKKVTSIGGSAFDGCNGLTSITIPDSVTSIGGGAFYSTPWLETKQAENPLVIVNGILIDGTTCSGDVVIPNNVTSIGYGAFGYCYELTSITIPDSVTSIGYGAFYDCSCLTSITIPNSVTSIGGSAFLGCSGLTEITIPDSVTSIGGSAFYSTPWLKEKQKENPLVIVKGVLIDGTTCSGDVVIPDSVKSIGNEAFDGCLGLTSITIPDNVTSIDYRAFGGCWGLTSITILNPNCEIYDDPNTISNDYDNGFNGTIYGYENSTAQAYAEKYNKKFESLGDAPAPETSLEYEVLDDGTIEITGCDKSVTTVEIPAEIDGKKVTSIGDNAFSNCSELTSVTISDGVMSIGNVAFSNCSTLTSITIPDSVTSIGVMAFNGTPWLENKQKDDTLVIVNGILIDGTTCTGDVIILDSVTSIGYWAFRDCSDMTSVTIPNSVTCIDDAAFNNCSQLTSITILNPDCEISGYEATISNDNDNSFVGTIYGYENSTAQAYAEKFNRKFESLGEAPATELAMGDVNGDNTIDSSDASVILVDYSLTSTGKKSTLTDAQKAAADIDKDGKIDSSDASFILSYYSYISTGGTETDMSKWMNN